MKIEQFEDIEAWQLARVLTQKVYRLTKKPDVSKDYGLKRQIQHAAGSSMHNASEGFDAETNTEFIRFLRYANDLVPKCKVNSMSPWMKATYCRTNTAMSTGRPRSPVFNPWIHQLSDEL